MTRTLLTTVLLSLGSASASAPSPVLAQLKREAQAMRGQVEVEWVRSFLQATDSLPPIASRTLWRTEDKSRYFTPAQARALDDASRASLVTEQVGEEVYYLRYSTPLAYARPLELLGKAGCSPQGKRIVDFGYGNIGQLRLLASLGADAHGIEVSPLLPVLYAEKGDQGRVNGKGQVRVHHGYFPTDGSLKKDLGGSYDLFLSKNTLKRGYIHPERPVSPKQRIDLGVSDQAFIQELHQLLKAGGWVLLYNICPAPAAPDQPYIPWADGRSPFSKKAWEEGGFEVLAFNREDDQAVRRMARTLGWDKEGMDVEKDLFALYTLVRKRPAR